ncbi:CRISPR-associated endonuclease Cas3'' [Desulforhabdus amnigena]|uniref:HD family phosphohydrolase n=1 Tax=Desulforhabdus amnigena TaxID=40218 RepID=A0A9W6D440_9BACT|nr:CRISPR-associated endonuclease Cas3'' [Desulforhabdus amnigena]NLJ27102.1 CRISPR-associated endonuclease Cas3'' [Deltaproteobacteria bacterium]GLI34539.1 HD family phosphohydrolase [Desulforhabdus amnigena]
MAKIFIADIQPSQEVATSFVLTDKQIRTARNGTNFLTLKLVDRTGEITGRVWEKADEVARTISTGSAVFVNGRSETFRDELQLQVQQIFPIPATEVDPADFLPVCPVDPEILLEKLKKIVGKIKRRSLVQLMRQILRDRELMERFKLAPAAKSMHHAYLGGLLEHTAAVAELASRISEHYPGLDRDLLIVGAILHDIGKIEEFVYDLSIDYSHSGRLLGHMILGVQILEEKLSTLKNFPGEEALLLKHLILSHHGDAQFGAVKLPMTREAFVLHFADDLDAKMNTLTRIMEDCKNGDETWTAYQPLFDRFFFRGLPSNEGETPMSCPESEEEKGVQLSIWPQERRNPS